MVAKKPILVTGAHRSGTTWVGRTLSASPSIGYIEEPFSPALRYYDSGTCNAKIDYWWLYITDDNDYRVYNDIAATLEFKYQLKSQLKRIIENKCGVRTFLKGFTRFLFNRYIYKARPLMKDPIALFSTEWLAKTFNMDVVILIRHPAAFVSSIKRMKWPHDFSNFLDQQLLLRDYLEPFEQEIRKHMERTNDIVDDAILLWNMFYYFVFKIKKSNQSYLILKHEDLSKNPIEEFRELFIRLNINFTERIEKLIIKYTSPNNPKEAPDGVMHQLKRNSLANIKNWKHRLSQEEIARVRAGVNDISASFYSDDDWK
jgi:hypothetical protein